MKELFKALNMSIGMFTVIPPFKKVWDEKCGRHMMKIFPIIGVLIGVLWYVGAMVLFRLQVPKMLSSALILAIPFLLTGFLHLDGFMDVCDALLSRREKEVKLRILKDSTVGAFSVISLVMLLLIEFSAINEIFLHEKKLIFFILIPVVSRAIVGYFLITEKSITESYFGKLYKEGTGILDKIILIVIYVITFLVFLIFNVRWIIVPIIMGIFSVYLLTKCKKELGGINGDVAGYIIVFSECIGLIMLAVI